MPKASSLYAQAILFAAVVGIILVGIDVRQIWVAKDARLREVYRDTANLARSLAQHAEDVFVTTDASLKSLRAFIIDNGTDQQAIARLNRGIRARVAAEKFLRSEFVFDENGDWLLSSLPPDAFEAVRHVNYADRAFFRFHRDHPEDVALIGPPIQARLDGTWVITISRRLSHPDGSFAGVLGATLKIDLFQTFFDSFDVGAHGAIALINDDGVVLVRRPYDPLTIGRQLVGAELLRQLQTNSEAGSYAYNSGVDHAPRVGSYHRVHGFNLFMAVSFDRGDVLAGWVSETRAHLAWLAVFVCIVVTLGYRLSRQIRDRVAAQALSQKLQLEAEQQRNSEAERRNYERKLEQSNQHLASLNDSIGRSEARFRQLIEAAPNAMVMSNADGKIEMVNAQTERLFGYTRAELLSAPIEMVLPASAGGDLFARLATATSHTAGPGSGLFGRKRDGRQFEVEIWCSPIETDDGIKLLSAIVDISDRLQLEAQVRQSQNLLAIGRVTAGVAHDFNNLLMALTGSLELLLDAVADQPAATEWGRIALRATMRGKELTDRLLSFSRKQVLTPRPVRIGAFFNELRGLIEHLFAANPRGTTELVMVPCPPDLCVMADIAQLEAALINLAVNARDAMEAGGCLRMSAYVADADPAIVPPGRYTVISVSDTGCGMDADTLKQACEPFFSTKGVDGTGLGLSMVYGFARQSGGALNITSVVGEGTTVDLWLPFASVAAEIEAPVPEHVEAAGHVLVVDDSQDALLVVSAFLRLAGLEVTSRKSGALALAELAGGRKFDAIVTDFAMPGMNGLQLLKQVREIDPALPGMIITGFSDPALLSEMNDTLVLRKPFNRAELTEAVLNLVPARRNVAARGSA